MYESKSKPLIARKNFRKRMLFHVLAAFMLVAVTLAAGIAGHVYFDNMEPRVALVASITLTSGLGLSILPETTSGQLFAGLYGVFSGYVYIATSTIIIAPILHRILHKFHLDEQLWRKSMTCSLCVKGERCVPVSQERCSLLALPAERCAS